MRTLIRRIGKHLFGKRKISFPWYDSPWLSSYVRYRDELKRRRSQKLRSFEQSMEIFRTPMDFKVKRFDGFLDAERLTEINTLICDLDSTLYEKHEASGFGRIVVHNHEYFNELQTEFTDFVSHEVGEEVEPSYNFLSLYSEMGRCEMHMDSPEAKWTLDICIAQSRVWPIFISGIEPWPEVNARFRRKNWQSKIKKSRLFESYELQPGDGIIFSGSSQWHYRDRITNARANDYCNLIFFHYIPKGTKEIIKPSNWAEIF